MTEFYLVRHALPTAGQSNPGLSEEGLEQANRLGKWLNGQEFSAIAASPLRRAEETANILAASLGHPSLQLFDELVELERSTSNDSKYTPAEQLGTSHPVGIALAEGRYEDLFPRGDWETFRQRAIKCRDLLLRLYPSGRVLVVAHGGIINAILASIIRLTDIFWYYPGYTSFSRMESLPSGRLVIRSLNEMPHLLGYIQSPMTS